MLEKQTYAADFWNDPESAQGVISQLNRLREIVKQYDQAASAYDEAQAAVELANDDEDFQKEAEKAVSEFSDLLNELELAQMLSGEFDDHNAILSIHAGAGGLEAQDWAEMLLRMYTRWTERHNYKTELIDSLAADEGGIKSATLAISGVNAYGHMKSERGVHRLVRISPFDTQSRRHTSFASVDVLPQVADDHEIEIAPEEIRIDTYRSSGKGGQHLNKTDSAVRITHLESGIVVQCQDQRSQFSNKEKAMQLLKAKLLDQKVQEREAELAKLRGDQQDIGWGSQIRSYVFHPYRLVKDHRTGMEMGNTDAVMDGELDNFIAEYLRQFSRID